MVLSEVDICNLALAQLGGKFTITSFDDETVGAHLCKANYAPLRDAVLEEMDWSFAIVEHQLLPDPEPSLISGQFKYKLPADTLRVITAHTGLRPIEEWSIQARYILADVSELLIRSIDSIKNTAMFSQAFTQALAARMSAEMAMPLTNSTSMAQAQWQLYGQKVSVARTNDNMQGTALSYPTGRIIRARRGH